MIENDDIDRLKEIFVTRQECDDTTRDLNDKLSRENTELQLIKQQVNTISWVAKTTLASLIGFIVVYIANLIV